MKRVDIIHVGVPVRTYYVTAADYWEAVNAAAGRDLSSGPHPRSVDSRAAYRVEDLPEIGRRNTEPTRVLVRGR